jgi:hypothetical protein
LCCDGVVQGDERLERVPGQAVPTRRAADEPRVADQRAEPLLGLDTAARGGTTRRIDTVRRLQAAGGNRAVARSLPVQRYDAYEHATAGDRAAGSRTATVGERVDDYTGARSGGLRLTSGEINALADLYGSPEQLYRADPAEVRRVLDLLHRQQRDPHSVQESEWDHATGGRYNRLNLRNSGHFGPSNPAIVAPRPGGSASNRDMFMQYYNETIVNGQEAYHFLGLPDPAQTRRKLDQATIAAGFTEHYIMDAFSAGHLFNKDDFIAQVRHNLDRLPPAQLTGLFRTVAQRVLANDRARRLLGRYEPAERPLGGWMPFRPNFDRQFAFQGLLEELYRDAEGRQAVYSSLVKVVHDRLNTRDAGAGLVGVPVENSVGSWVLSGDRTLDRSPQTQQMIDRAISQFRQNIQPYLAGPVPPTPGGRYCPGAELVTALFPRPTTASATMIAEMIARVTDPDAGMIDALVEILLAELPSTIEALVDRGRIRPA